jgi:methionine sulfoxide reductase heme-binding subunit
VRLSLRTWIILGAALGLLVVFATNQVLPPTNTYQAQIRLWLAARATGITSYLLLTALVSFGLILSHPTNQSTWKLSKTIFPWHENLFVFVVAFTAAHVVSLLLDPYANVGIQGALIPGLSQFRTVPVAVGTVGLYAIVLSGLTARWTQLLPKGVWLKLHRLALVGWILSWAHGILAGADSVALIPMYAGTGVVVIASGAYRYWVSKKARATFASSLPSAAGTPRRQPAPVLHEHTGLRRVSPPPPPLAVHGRVPLVTAEE